MTYTDKLLNAIRSAESVLCVGLDPAPERLPAHIMQQNVSKAESIYQFCKIVIEETLPFAAAYKPNLGFFEAFGSEGIIAFERILDLVPSDKIIVADAKRGDIGNTSTRYREAFFKTWGCDSVTLSPLMGFETITPFLTDDRFGTYVLTLTSNPGSSDFMMKPFDGFNTMSGFIASNLAELSERFPGHPGMVLGATRPEMLHPILNLHPSAHLLIPGVGAQGGSIKDLALVLKNHKGLPLVNVSRGIMFGEESEPMDEDAVREGVRYRAEQYQTDLRVIFNQLDLH